MKKKPPRIAEQFSESIKSNKNSFRQHQRNLSFSEKMEIAFSLAKRDQTIRRSALLPKKTKDEKVK